MACNYSYAMMCGGPGQPMTCNGKEYDANPGAPGDQDAVTVTGSATFSSCYTDWATEGRVYDMSGNVKEWTSTPAFGVADAFQQRGGAYTSIEAGRSCDYDFTVANRNFAFPNTGFRCCYY